MAKKASDRLLRVSKAKNGHIKLWREGLALESTTGQTIDDLMKIAATGRWRLASTCLRQGRAALRREPPEYRLAISRLYYAMYHAARAVVYVAVGGDDHEEHKILPGQIPDDLSGTNWQNRLKDARETRNRADYDPFPIRSEYWKKRAFSLGAEASELVQASREYLQNKGCGL